MRHLLRVGLPPLRTYLFYLHPLSILAQDEKYLPWLYSRHIQLLYYPGECLKMLVEPGSTSPQLSHAYALSCPLLDVQSLELGAFQELNPDAAAACAALIVRGYYVQLDADLFHLAHCPEYGREHFVHEVLLCGVDADGLQLIALAYGTRGEPTQVMIQPEVLRRATAELAPVRCTRAGPDRGASSSSCGAAAGSCPEPAGGGAVPAGSCHGSACTCGVPSWPSDMAAWGRPRVVLYRYHPERPCVFDAGSVREQVSDYLGAVDSSQRYRLVGVARAGGVWGMSVYGWLHDQLEQLRSGRVEWEPLTWRVLWEHKVCMQRRLEFMGQLKTPPTAALAQRYGPTASWARSLQLLLLRWSAARSPAALETAHDLLSRMAALEAKVLEQLLATD